MADSRTFPCTDEKLAALATMLAQHELTVDLTHAGEAKQGSWDIAWVFPSPTTVQVTVLSHPFAEEGIFWSKIGAALA